MQIDKYMTNWLTQICKAKRLLPPSNLITPSCWEKSRNRSGNKDLIVVFARQIIDFLYGKDYIKYENVLFGFALLYLFVFTGLLLRFFIRTVEKNRDIFISYLLSAGFSLLLAAPMVSSFGMAGVFAGLILTQVIVQLWYLYSLKTELVTVWK